MNKQNLKLGESYNRYMQMYVYARHHVNVMYNAIYIYTSITTHHHYIIRTYIYTDITSNVLVPETDSCLPLPLAV